MSTGVVLSWKFFCDIHLIKRQQGCIWTHWLQVLACVQLELSQRFSTSHCLCWVHQGSELTLRAVMELLPSVVLDGGAPHSHAFTMPKDHSMAIPLCYFTLCATDNTYLYKVVSR